MDMISTLVDVYLLNYGTGENNKIVTSIDYGADGRWNFSPFTKGAYACDCARSEILYDRHPYYLLPCNEGANQILLKVTLSGKKEQIIYQEELLEEDDKTNKIMREINDLTPYLPELQEFKEKGLYLPEGASQTKPLPLLDEHGKPVKTGKVKKLTKAQTREALRNQAFKLRVLTINKWLDDAMIKLLPKWAVKLVRRLPQYRHIVLKFFIINVSIVHSNRPVPFGSDLVTIKCFFKTYDEVRFVWEK